MIILVTGTRTDARKGAISKTLSALVRYASADEPFHLIVGDATGVDAEANEWYEKYTGKKNPDKFYADWNTLGKFAGPERNGRMVALAKEAMAVVLAVYHPDPTQRRGTNDCVKQAKEAGLTVLEVL